MVKLKEIKSVFNFLLQKILNQMSLHSYNKPFDANFDSF
jgi:hypothetical protein